MSIFQNWLSIQSNFDKLKLQSWNKFCSWERFAPFLRAYCKELEPALGTALSTRDLAPNIYSFLFGSNWEPDSRAPNLLNTARKFVNLKKNPLWGCSFSFVPGSSCPEDFCRVTICTKRIQDYGEKVLLQPNWEQKSERRNKICQPLNF